MPCHKNVFTKFRFLNMKNVKYVFSNTDWCWSLALFEINRPTVHLHKEIICRYMFVIIVIIIIDCRPMPISINGLVLLLLPYTSSFARRPIIIILYIRVVCIPIHEHNGIDVSATDIDRRPSSGSSDTIKTNDRSSLSQCRRCTRARPQHQRYLRIADESGQETRSAIYAAALLLRGSSVSELT